MPLPISRNRLGAAALLLVAALATGCARTVPAPRSTAAPLPFPAATAIQWQRVAAEFPALTRQVYLQATEALERVAAGREPGTWAISLDADETIIDNSLYALERQREGRQSYTAESWDAWVRRREATPIAGAAAFLARVRELGGIIAIVTNRLEDQCADTAANLDALALAYDVILCRPPGPDGSKEPRWEALRTGTAVSGLGPVEILLWVGDNVGDFPGLDQSLRRAPAAAFGDFGKRFFVLPNAAYGSWEKTPVE
ncbi:MAG TPA: HAD family acid phosphatase [Thermoanaerobaculia bacterium]|nr:HAD family acid phosphatase [Thermoanaerobaculia bacterium]